MRKFITDFAPTVVLDDIKVNINKAIDAFKPYEVSLTDEEKVGVRTMSQGREGYVRLVSTIATQFPDALSRADKPEDLSTSLDYYADVRAVRAGALQFLEMTDEILLGSGMDNMSLSDRYVDNLQISRKNSSALDLNMRDVDEYNRRFRNKPNDDTPAPAENPGL